MILMKSRSHFQSALSCVSIALGACCFAVSPVQSQTVSSSKSNQPLLLAKRSQTIAAKVRAPF